MKLQMETNSHRRAKVALPKSGPGRLALDRALDRALGRSTERGYLEITGRLHLAGGREIAAEQNVGGQLCTEPKSSVPSWRWKARRVRAAGGRRACFSGARRMDADQLTSRRARARGGSVRRRQPAD